MSSGYRNEDEPTSSVSLQMKQFLLLKWLYGILKTNIVEAHA